MGATPFSVCRVIDDPLGKCQASPEFVGELLHEKVNSDLEHITIRLNAERHNLGVSQR